MIRDIGIHRVRCGNVMENLDELFNGAKANLFYSDPPWGQGNLRYWQTMNTKMNGAAPLDIDLQEFLHRIFDVAVKYTTDDAVIFIEYGVQWNEHLKDIAKEHGLVHSGQVEMLYSSESRPLILNIFGKKPVELPDGYLDSLYHTSGYKSVKTAITPFVKDGMTICDPCCGLGNTAHFAVDSGCRFIGNEINAKRLEKTIARLGG